MKITRRQLRALIREGIWLDDEVIDIWLRKKHKEDEADDRGHHKDTDIQIEDMIKEIEILTKKVEMLSKLRDEDLGKTPLPGYFLDKHGNVRKRIHMPELEDEILIPRTVKATRGKGDEEGEA